MVLTAASHPLNCSLALPPTPAPSQIFLKEDGAPASPFCLGGGLWYVAALEAPTSLTRAYPGLLATKRGLTSSI